MPAGQPLQVGDVIQVFFEEPRVGPFAAICTDTEKGEYREVYLLPSRELAWRVSDGGHCLVMPTPGYYADDWVGSSLPPISWQFIPRA
jgi:hypothetical protein